MSQTLAKREHGLFAYSNWDAVPVIAALLHAGYIVGMFVLFPHVRWWAMAPLGLVYSVSITWNINGISHNFIHNPYFRWWALNRTFGILESLVCGFSQVFYDAVHRRHHMGNSDHQDEHGDTIDWLSIYRHGHDGVPENPWSYVFLSYFRDDIGATYREVVRRSPTSARWGIAEIVCVLVVLVAAIIIDWKCTVFLVPFYYLGHSLSSLNGYYRHFGGNPDRPIAWGVSSYGWMYNLLWFNNGYHAEHHFRPKVHWTQMKRLQREIVEQQREAGTRVIHLPHALGFLDPSLNDAREANAMASKSYSENVGAKP